MNTKDKLIMKAKKLFAEKGYDGVSMRHLAVSTGVNPSITYYYFSSKDALLKEIFHTTNSSLGEKRRKLPPVSSASHMLHQRIVFQFDNAEDIVFVLKYYLEFRKKFTKSVSGFLPDKTYLHIEEVLAHGIQTGEFSVENLHDDAQVIAHSINGFLLEYFPYKLGKIEKERVVNKIHRLHLRALTNHEK